MTDQDEIVARCLEEVAGAYDKFCDGIDFRHELLKRAKALRSPPRQSEGGLELFVARHSDGKGHFDSFQPIPEAVAVIEAARQYLLADEDHSYDRRIRISRALATLDKRLNPKVES